MGDVGRFRLLGGVITRDSFRGMWEVIQPAEEGKLEVSYRWFRTCKDAEDWCMRKEGAGTQAMKHSRQCDSLIFHLESKGVQGSR